MWTNNIGGIMKNQVIAGAIATAILLSGYSGPYAKHEWNSLTEGPGNESGASWYEMSGEVEEIATEELHIRTIPEEEINTEEFYGE